MASQISVEVTRRQSRRYRIREYRNTMARRGGQLEERESVQVKGKKEWAREGVFASNKDIPPLLPTVG